MADDLVMNDLIDFVPAVPPEKVYEELVECDLGICSYLLNEQAHLTLPGKLFEYMSVGLPVLSSARKPVVRILEKCGNGSIYHSRDPKEIAEKLKFFYESPSLRREMGEKSRNAILNEFNEDTNIKSLEGVLLN